MNQDDRDLLISIHTKMEIIEKAFDKEPYAGLVNKVKTHARFLWPTILLVIGGTFKIFFGGK